jgi:GNAT superfamily N-acetyltransferase
MHGHVAVAIRPFAPHEIDVITERWHDTNRACFPYVAEYQRHTLDDDRRFFGEQVVPRCAVWIAEAEGEPVGLIACRAPWIEHLSVFAGWRQRGVGTRLVEVARAHSPRELRAFTFQRNLPARAFYERHGFRAVAFGVSPAPESEPDVEYAWTPP